MDVGRVGLRWAGGENLALGRGRCIVSTSTRPFSPFVTIAQQEDAGNSSTRQGWFYDRFVKDNTMEAKLKKFKADVAARNGYVGSWFEDSFKYTAWVEVHRKLTERNLKSLECKEAYDLSFSDKVVLIDVREAEEFEKVHAEKARCAPLFRLIQGNDLKANMRRLGYALITNFAGTGKLFNFIGHVSMSHKHLEARVS